MKRSGDVLDVILDGPRVQVPVECLERTGGRTRPTPPPPPEPLQTGLELEDGSVISLEDDLDPDMLCRETAPAPEPDGATWACPAHWLLPSMRAEGGTIWLDPEPLRLAAPVSLWLSAKSENGRAN